MVACLFAAMILAQDGQSSVATFSGLVLVTLEKPEGSIHVYLPSDVSAGDTISGRVVAVPKGGSQNELEANEATLRGTVVAIGTTEFTVEEGQYQTEFPEEATEVSISAKGAKPITVSVAPSGWALLQREFTVPAVAKVGRPLTVSGPFDGDARTTTVSIGGRNLTVLAESPRQAVVSAPIQPVSSTKCEITEGETTTEHELRFVQIQLTSPQTTLTSGQRTRVDLTVSGLEGLEEPFKIRITNNSPQTISLEGGDVQELEVRPDDVLIGGICGFALNIIAKTPGGFQLGAEVVPPAILINVPDGFKEDPDKPGVVIPDDTELEKGDKIKPKRFLPKADDEDNTGGDGKWQKSDLPEESELDDVTVWFQHISTLSYSSKGHLYRGGHFPIHFKYTGTECLPGKWRQIVRSTLYTGDSVDSLKPAHFDNGRYVPHPDSSHKGDWKIDTNSAGRSAKNPDYPNQDKGEMLDTPSRSKRSFSGYYSTDTEPRKRAKVIREEVEILSFWIGPGGEICKIIKWGFVTTWEVREEDDDPFTESAKNKAKVSTTFTDPVVVDGASDEGKAAKEAYEGALESFMK